MVSARKRLAIVIVHYRTPGLLRDCLATLLPQLDAARDEVIVVDNASPDGSGKALRNLSGITLVESATNAGFAAGNNIGIRHRLDRGGADFYLLLNPDTLVRENAVGQMLSDMAASPQIAILGPRLADADGTPQLSAFGDHTPMGELMRGANIGPIARAFRRWQVYGEVQNQPHRADWVSGACMLIRSAVIERIGMLDDGYFMYYEETDFCRRARQAGFEIWHVPRARVAHLEGSASGLGQSGKGPGGRASRRVPAYWFESRQRYFRKHYGYFGAAAADGLYVIGHAMDFVRRAVTRRSRSVRAPGEMRDFLSHSLRALAHPRSPERRVVT